MKHTLKVFSTHKQASFQYSLETFYEAGLSLEGWEVVAIRQGQLNLTGSYISIQQREAFLVNANITPLKTSTIEKMNPTRARKLLLHKKELNKLIGATQQKGMSIIPTKVYLKNGKLKLQIALAKGKKSHDKRQAIKERDIKREQMRTFKDG